MKTFNDSAFFEKRNTLHDCIAHEMEQFKTHQSLSLKKYIKERMSFLETQKNADLSMEYLKGFQPNIAVFAGSFNPFHKGHYNILQKAERIFDKVIIAFGQNPEKGERDWPIPNSIKNRQI